MQQRFASLGLVLFTTGCAIADTTPTDTRRNDATSPSDTGTTPIDSGVRPMDGGVTDTGVAPADTGVAPVDTGVAPPCDMGQTRCGANCTSLLTDGLNCGACGNACPAGQACMSGSCVATCPMGTTRCGSSCVDAQSNTMHCGRCDNACAPRANATPVCNMGSCDVRCGAGFAECDGNPANGCETDTTSSALHCGACGRTCTAANATPSCVSGTCGFTCSAGFGDCDMSAANGCEANTNTAIAHCGRCGNACPAPTGGTATCTAGVCGTSCPMGQMLCGSACLNTQTDVMNCGACGRACSAGQVCTAGVCGAPLPTRYTQTTSTQAFLNACTASGRVTVLSLVDDSSAAITTPFAIRYWARNIAAGSTLYVSSNGNLQMTGSGSGTTSGTLPSSSTPNGVVAPYWRDLETSSSGVCVATFGTAPNRQWVIQWQAATHYASTSQTLTFEVVFTETSNTIDFVYSTMTGAAASPTQVGIETDDGAMGVGGCPGGTYACAPAANSRTRFTPAP